MLGNDIRYALRMMRRSPGFTAVAVLSLALGIGANTAIFSLFNTIVLRNLPVARPGELVELLRKYPGHEPRGGYWGWENFEYFRDRNHVFSVLTGMSFDNLARVGNEGSEPETLILEHVLGNYFPVLGLKPAIGRLISPEDVAPNGSGSVVVVSWSYWNRRLHRDSAILGQRINVNHEPLTIVGVAPRDYSGPRVGVQTDLWMPREKDQVTILGRLKPGVTIQQARAETAVLYQALVEQRFAKTKDPRVLQLKVELEPAGAGLAHVRDQYGKPLMLLMVVVGLLQLLACINLAGMLLARSAGRQREIAVRVSLGAGRGRLVFQMLTESLLLSGAGTAAGVLLAYFATGGLVRIMSSGRAHERIDLDVQPDVSLLLFTAGIALLTGVLFGLAPAWYAFRSAPASHLRHGGTAVDTKSWRWFGKSLVSAQVALSVLLVTAAAVFLTHLSGLRNLDLGFRRDHVLLMALDPELSGYKREQLGAPYQELLARLERIPGVRSATISGCTPIQGCGASRFVTADGFQERPEDRRFTALSWIAPRYFETLGIPLIAGRDFTFKDAGRSRVAIISESMARYYFPGTDPIGRYVAIDNDAKTGGWYGDGQPYEVVGVAGDAKYVELREPAPRTMYLNMFQEGRLLHQFSMLTSMDPASIIPPARAAVRDVLRTPAVRRVTTLSEQVDAAIVPERLVGALSGYFGALGAVLAGIGLYGLLAYTVARRTNEIGVRMALGATTGNIRRLVLTEALAMVFAGLLAGVPLARWCRPLAASVLEDFHPSGAGPLAWGAAAIIAIAMLAAYVPVRRAVRVDPIASLRHE